jgi:hypothetical protein
MPGLEQVLVSVQALGFDADPRAGHLAAAVLGDNDLALVPDPPPQLLDPDQEFEVLTIPVPLNPRLSIERIDVRCSNVLRMATNPDRPVAAVFKLGRASQYQATIAPFNAGTLGDELEANGGDLWAALEQLRIAPTGLRDGPPVDVLDGLPAIERLQRRVVTRVHDHVAAKDIAFSLCQIFCICQPG